MNNLIFRNLEVLQYYSTNIWRVKRLQLHRWNFWKLGLSKILFAIKIPTLTLIMSRIKKRCLFSGRTILKFIVIIKHCHFKSQVISGRELKDWQPSHPSPTLVIQPLSYPLTRTRYQVSSLPKPPSRFNSKSALAWPAFTLAKLQLYCRMLRIPLPGISPFPIKFLPPLLPGFRLCSRPPVLLQRSREKAPTEHWCGRSGYNYTLKWKHGG